MMRNTLQRLLTMAFLLVLSEDAATAESLKHYLNSKWGLSFDFPDTWTLRQGSGNCVVDSFSFKLKHGKEAQLILTYVGKSSKPYAEYIQNYFEESADPKKIQIGPEQGLESIALACQEQFEMDPRSCFVSGEYLSEGFFSRGLDLTLWVNIPSADSQETDNPSRFVEDNDLKPIRDLLRSVAFTSPTTPKRGYPHCSIMEK